MEELNPSNHETIESYQEAFDKLTTSIQRLRNVLVSSGTIEFSLDPLSEVVLTTSEGEWEVNLDLTWLSADQLLERTEEIRLHAQKTRSLEDLEHMNNILTQIASQYESQLTRAIIINDSNPMVDGFDEGIESYVISWGVENWETDIEKGIWNGFRCRTDNQRLIVKIMLGLDWKTISRAEIYEKVYDWEKWNGDQNQYGRLAGLLKPFRQKGLIENDNSWNVWVAKNIHVSSEASLEFDDSKLLSNAEPWDQKVSPKSDNSHTSDVIEEDKDDLWLNEEDAYVYAELLKRQGREIYVQELNSLFPNGCTMQEAMRKIPQASGRINEALKQNKVPLRIVREGAKTTLTKDW